MLTKNEAGLYTYSVHKEPMFGDRIRIKEKSRTNQSLIQEVRCEGRDPLEDRESSTSFEYEHGDGLLKDKANDDSGPESKENEFVGNGSCRGN
jgi:hypothetical protein